MPHSDKTPIDLAPFARPDRKPPVTDVATMARGLVGSEILKIAADIRALVRGGQQICNLTVGDFDPKHFPIPAALCDAIVAAYRAGETNYPPSNGMQELREAVQQFYRRELGLSYPTECVLIAAGARPIIYGTYRAVVDPGDRVVYPVPSWNNNHYVHMLGAVGVPVPCDRETRFLPSRAALQPFIAGARLLCINSPLNPSGTAIAHDAMREICEMVLDENRARTTRGERPLYLMYDHIYWMLCYGETAHVTPPGIDPEMARYTIFVDGISKGFAATGVRVGWAVGPADVVDRMSAILGHVGAWAPRAEQVATAKFLADTGAIRAYHATMQRAAIARLELLHDGLVAMREDGLPVESLAPAGAIYLSARFHAFGKRTPDGTELRTNEDVRRYLLSAAGFAIVPFQAFGVTGDDGWFRLSIGAVGEDEIRAVLPRVARALRELR